MEPNIFAFDGLGSYRETVTKSSEITVLKNENSGNFIFFLKTESYGPVIVDSDYERGKAKFMKAFEKMLIFKSLMSIEEVREKVAAKIKLDFPVVGEEMSKVDLIDIANEAAKKMEKMKKEVELI